MKTLSADPVIAHAPHHHGSSTEPNRLTVVLVGNPNVGKSVVFNVMSGMYVDVSNFPGTTIEISRARYGDFDLIDTPGIYGVASFNDEECVARDIIVEADLVLNIVDAVHLERDLFLTRQLVDMGKRMVVLVNMMDEAERRGLRLDLPALADRLGVPVIGIVATKKQGLDRIPSLLTEAREGCQDPRLHATLHEELARVGSQAEALLVLEGDPIVAGRHGIPPYPASHREDLYVTRRNAVNADVEAIVHDAGMKNRISAALGRWAVGPVSGIPFLAIVLYLLYLFVGVFVAQDVVGFTEERIGTHFVERSIKMFTAKYTASTITITHLDENDGAVSRRDFVFPEGTDAHPTLLEELEQDAMHGRTSFTFTYRNPWVVMFFGEFGALTMTLTYLLFLLLPLVLGFYLALSVLEDSGYLPRLATLVDRLLRMIGLNGRAIIPLILGFGCVTMATITTRLLGTQREKTIATTILQLAIPCSAQLGVIAALLAGAGPLPALIYSAIILLFLILVGTLLSRWIPGETSPLLIDLPPMRLPRLGNILQKTGFKTWFFMKEASPWFFFGALLISVLQVTGLLEHIQNALQPLVVHWMKLPKEAATAFVMGLVRRDFGAAGLYDLSLTPFQVVASLVTITLFVPCVASLMVMLKERGLREGLTIWVGSLVLALAIGGLVAQMLV